MTNSKQGPNDQTSEQSGSTTTINTSELQQLQATVSKLKAIFEATTDFGIIVVDRQGIITEWNSGAERMFGFKREHAIGQHTDIIFTTEDQAAGISMAEIEKADKSGRSIDERWHMHQDGTRFFVSGVMTPLRGGMHHGFVKIARNITERKLAEEALLLLEQRKSLAVKSAEMGEWEWDLTTNVIQVTDEVNLLLGLDTSVDEVSPLDMLERIFPEDKEKVLRKLNQAFNGINIFEAECRIIRGDNKQVRWASVYGRIVRHSTGRPSKMIGVLLDINSRKVLEKHKDDFIGLASHELRTPLTAMRAYVELLAENLHDDAVNLPIINKLNSQVERLMQLVKNLLDTSILEEGRMKLNPQPLDLNELIDYHLETFKAIAADHTVTWKPGKVSSVHADRERIMQVLTNFVSNSAKYTPRGTEIVITTIDELEQVKVQVKDQGPGISDEAQALIFERYYRLNDTVHQKGFGLGLYICAEIIREHHGEIGVKSNPGDGSAFYFTLPYT